MKAAWTVLTGALSISVLAVPVAGNAQPAVEQFRFDPPQLCLRDVFQWGFSYRRIPGGLAAVKDLAMEGVFEGRTVRSPLTPAREDLQPHTADPHRGPGAVPEPAQPHAVHGLLAGAGTGSAGAARFRRSIIRTGRPPRGP
jgi:hypothetical protein